jgi:hypothetical protein
VIYMLLPSEELSQQRASDVDWSLKRRTRGAETRVAQPLSTTQPVPSSSPTTMSLTFLLK